MIINLKNKDTLIVDDFKFKCSIGLKGTKKNKVEGDKATPKGFFSIQNLYYRPDRVPKPKFHLKIKKIYRNLGWCNDPKSKFYNSEIIINRNIKHEKLFRRDHKYDYFLVINYNPRKTAFRGSAIFIHLTKNYKPTAGCIALKKKDFLIMLKLIKKKSKIRIN